MDPYHNIFLFVSFLILCLAANEVAGYATVTGSVFCDQCKDGERSLFDFPVSGVKVSVTCSDGNGQVYMSREETTNWLGGYVMRFDGTPDLSNCYAQVSDNGAQQDPNSCSIASGPAQKLKLMFSFFGVETFAADALLAQPLQPRSFCPKPPAAPVMPPPQVPVMPPPQVPVKPPPQVPAKPPAQVPVINPPPATLPPPQVPVISPPPVTSPPQFKLPPLPPLPPVPFVEASACSHQLWMKPEYRCYWRAIGPDTKVAVAFGLVAGRRYGTDMTIREALDGRGEAYKTLLREATTALLNSYNSLGFPYNSISVITHTNLALLGNSQHDVLMTAIRFIKANSGTCRFTVCN
ncbi:PREDICTED: CASP-like protein 4A2 [Camelina sativa]|uniref:CASP-like protein 4A2 n=1 Tax=Camelina sativa TaxID=90675 RepID=A0ABM0W8W6_CAMSA|nr:PREDICTED: CASP-like protein 4A2 [Camelina sativa]